MREPRWSDHGLHLPAAAFFQAGQTPGVILLEIRELLDPLTPPLTPTVTLSVEGDGQDPARPNNFATATQELTSKGALRVTRSDLSARTVVGADGKIRRIVTQHLHLRNDGPGSVSDITGDGEIPSDRNNNRARGSLLYQPVRLHNPRIVNGVFVVDVILAGEGAEVRLEQSETLTGPWSLITPALGAVEIRLPIDTEQRFVRPAETP